MARVEWLAVAGPIEPWTELGLVDVDGLIPLFGTGLRFGAAVGDAGVHGLTGWGVSGLDEPVSSIDGVATIAIEPEPPVLVDHPLGAFELDHVVVNTGSLDRTCAAITAATGAPLKRVREVGPIRQGFHRLGGLIVEVVERVGQPIDDPASLWGLVFNVADLDASVDLLGPDRCGPPRDAVQPGRRIATVRGEVGLSVPVALMTPDPRR
jgi:hypothetical protein